jgi:hypothetical protein
MFLRPKIKSKNPPIKTHIKTEGDEGQDARGRVDPPHPTRGVNPIEGAKIGHKPRQKAPYKRLFKGQTGKTQKKRNKRPPGQKSEIEARETEDVKESG